MSTAAIESPCIGVCMINAEEERCFGCFRTLDEIAAWSTMTPAKREAVMSELEARREASEIDL